MRSDSDDSKVGGRRWSDDLNEETRSPGAADEQRMPEEAALDPTRLGPIHACPGGKRSAPTDPREFFPEDAPTGNAPRTQRSAEAESRQYSHR
ncbi:MAG: hypothetical protein SFU56_08605 [Capsulimonadales bacterium]|nr:hypothetical protein [Capsulimonadales bacterium]